MTKLELPESLRSFVSQAKAEPGAEPWRAEYAAGRFPEALAAVESELGATPDSPLPRLAWILIQLELGRVPLTALSSPMTELLPAAKENPALHRISAAVLLSLAARLAEKSQLRLGLSLLEGAGDLSRQAGIFSAGEDAALHTYGVSYLEEELARAKTRRESADYIRRLEKKLEEKRTHKPAPPPAAKQPRPRKNTLSSKQLFEDALNGDSGPHSTAAAVAAIDAQPIDISAGAPAEKRGKNFSPLVLVLMLIIGLALLITRGLGALFDTPLDAEPGMLLAMSTKEPPPAAMTLPEVRLDRHALLSQKMDSINTNLEQVGERLKNIDTKTGDPGVDQAAIDASQSSLAKVEKKSEDELVPLDGPSDPNAAPTAAPVDPRRTPRLDPGAAAQVKVEDLDAGGITPPLHAPTPDLRVGNDGRLYGPPADRDPALDAKGKQGEARALDGSPLRSYEVEQFPEPQLYRTIVPTNVLTSPSLLASAVSRLERDTSVQVVSRMGQWLELRSTQGRRGYIFAQDAVPAK